MLQPTKFGVLLFEIPNTGVVASKAITMLITDLVQALQRRARAVRCLQKQTVNPETLNLTT